MPASNAEAFDFGPVPAPLASATAAEQACSHCGLPVAPSRMEPEALHQFCCPGCATVFEVLHSQGLEPYYAQRDALGVEPRPAHTTGRDYTELDEPSFWQRHVRQQGDRRELDLLLEGVHCAACVWLVERLPTLLPTLASARLDFARRVVNLQLRPGTAVSLSEIARTLDSLGYPPHPYSPNDAAQAQRSEERRALIRIAVAGASAGNVMLLALALYSGADPSYAAYFRWLSLLVAAPSVLWAAQPFYRGARAALALRRPHMDVPISLGIVMGGGWGAVSTVTGSGEVYFDSVTILIFLLLVGRFVQARQQRRAQAKAGGAFALVPRTARVLDGEGASRRVDVDDVRPGQLIEVLAGETIPVDGVVELGQSHADLAWLTGEFRPLRLEPNVPVLSGSTNLDDRVVVRVTQAGAETRLGKLCREVEAASRRRAPIAELADRLSAYFTVSVLGLAGLALWHFWEQGPTAAFDAAIALLIVTCPCALGLATPLAVSSALGQAAGGGFLIKGGAFLDALAKPAHIVFDKTGTLTYGQLSLCRWFGEKSLQPAVLGLELRSAHPIARAVCSGLAHLEPAAVHDVVHHQGRGIRGQVAGSKLFVGALEAKRAELPAWAQEALQHCDQAGWTPVGVYCDGELEALMGLGDRIRDDAAATLAQLAALGYRSTILSGDDPVVVERVAAQLERAAGRRLFELTLGRQTPEDKLAWVEERARGGAVFMVGDGVNDAGALSAATVGIAVHGGAEASVEAADVLCTRQGVRPIATLIAGARRTRRVIVTNLAVSLGYNAVAASLAFAGAISPLSAAVLMPLSSLSVIAHSYRRRMFRRNG